MYIIVMNLCTVWKRNTFYKYARVVSALLTAPHKYCNVSIVAIPFKKSSNFFFLVTWWNWRIIDNISACKFSPMSNTHHRDTNTVLWLLLLIFWAANLLVVVVSRFEINHQTHWYIFLHPLTELEFPHLSGLLTEDKWDPTDRMKNVGGKEKCVN